MEVHSAVHSLNLENLTHIEPNCRTIYWTIPQSVSHERPADCTHQVQRCNSSMHHTLGPFSCSTLSHLKTPETGKWSESDIFICLHTPLSALTRERAPESEFIDLPHRLYPCLPSSPSCARTVRMGISHSIRANRHRKGKSGI